MAICFSTEGMIGILFDIKITSYFLSYSKSVKNAKFKKSIFSIKRILL